MKLGVNLSFAIKRWIEPNALADVVAGTLGMKWVQYTWDLTDPWWPQAERDRLARAHAEALSAAGCVVESSFGGLASYSYSHFLAPSPELRRLGREHLKRAIDMTAAMGVPAAGMPFGSYSAADAVDPARREEILKEAEATWVDLAEHAKRQGLDRLLVEPVPLATEFPARAAEAARLMRDLDGHTAVPVRLCVDWGHALFRPLFGAEADMELWADTCGAWIDCYHIQQTDGELDRHWSFTQDGVVTRERLEDYWTRHGLRDQTYFAEIIYPFEMPDEAVLGDMVAGLARLQRPEAG
jgi:sugar phosphate isomerase/epimerase